MHKLTLLFGLLALSATSCSFIINDNVKRIIDVQSQFVRNGVEVDFTNKGSEPVSVYQVSIPPHFRGKLGRITAVVAGDDKKLTVSSTPKFTEDGKQPLYDVVLPKPLLPGESLTLDIELVYTHSLHPSPPSVPEFSPEIASEQLRSSGKQQTLLYGGDDRFWYSPYHTSSVATQFKVRDQPKAAPDADEEIKKAAEAAKIPISFLLVDHTEDDKTILSDDEGSIFYGPYSDVKPFTEAEMKVHFKSTAPLITITRLERNIEVSHWGNIAVEDRYWVRSDGPELNGPFDRLIYQRSPPSFSAISAFELVLERGASDIYYRDEVGNISTSKVYTGNKGVELHLEPRFPLFGGWKTAFTVGYNLPLSSFVEKDPETHFFVLNALAAPIFENAVIDHLIFTVILPEGTKKVSFETKLSHSEPEFSSEKTYLDLFGRKVATIELQNVIPERELPIQTLYNYNKIMMLQQPILFVIGIVTLFIAFFGLSRLNFSISNEKVHDKDTILRECLKELYSINETCSHLHSDLSSAFENFRIQKQLPSWHEEQKQINADLAAAHKELDKIALKINKEDPDIGNRVLQMSKKEKALLSHRNEVFKTEEKIVMGQKVPELKEKQLKAEKRAVETLQKEIAVLMEGLFSS